MSTFYGGEQLVAIKNFQRAGTLSASYTIYTVPAGHYAVFYIKQAILDSLIAINMVHTNGITSEILPQSAVIAFSQESDGYIMGEGDSIRFVAGGLRPENYVMSAREYKMP
jgi:hypothetical protein